MVKTHVINSSKREEISVAEMGRIGWVYVIVSLGPKSHQFQWPFFIHTNARRNRVLAKKVLNINVCKCKVLF